MNTQSPIDTAARLIPLDQLYLHPMNPRQNGSDADTDAMARSIAVNGLMQNLLGFADPDHPDKVGIVAGGRRLAGLHQLHASGSESADSKEPDWDAIPVRVTDDVKLAQSWAASESATQQPLNPADEIRAYAAMADQGSNPDMIARAFARTERHVKGRLALAGLETEALDSLRAGHISLDVAKALTMAGSPEHQVSVLTVARSSNRGADWVRRELTSDKVRGDDRRVRFISLELYRSEGGSIDSDLFEDHVYLHDEKLIDDLFTRELARQAEALREESGWQWVKTTKEPWEPYDQTKDLTRLHRTRGTLPDGDAAEYEDLEEMANGGVLDEDGHVRLADLQARLDGDYTDDDRENGGIIVLVNNHGEMIISGAYREKAASTASGTGAPSNASTTPKPALSQAGVTDLRRISLMALQGAMVDKTEFLLDLFAWQIERDQPAYASPFDIALTRQTIEPDAAGSWQMDKRLDDSTVKEPDHKEDTAAAFAAFQKLGKKHRNQTLARGLARTLQEPQGRMAALGQIMIEFAGVDIRKVWTPDGPTYLNRLSVSALEALWAELLDLDQDDERRGQFAKLKKAAKVKELSDLFCDASTQEAHGLSRDQVAAIDAWLPPEMQTSQI